MKFSSHVYQNVIILSLEGDLIGENSGIEILDHLNNRINEGLKQCAIDLSKVRYMNSSGIGVLISILTKFRNKGGDIVLVNPSDQIKKLFIITKLNSIFIVSENVDDAILKLKSN